VLLDVEQALSLDPQLFLPHVTRAIVHYSAQGGWRFVDAVREPTADLVRRLLVAVLLHGNRRALLCELDATLLGTERVAQLRAS